MKSSIDDDGWRDGGKQFEHLAPSSANSQSCRQMPSSVLLCHCLDSTISWIQIVDSTSDLHSIMILDSG